MATEFDRQVILELLMTPTSFVMEFVGISAAGLAGMDVIGPWGYLIGLVSVLGGVGWSISRIILDPEKVVGDMLQKKKEKSRKEKDAELEEFDEELTDTSDWDVRRSFRELRSIYEEFVRQSPAILDVMRDEIESQFMQLFDMNYTSLKNAHANLITVREIESDRLKKPFVSRRKATLQSVKASMDQMVELVNGLSDALDIKDESAVIGLHESLQDNLEIMKDVVAEETRFLSSKSYE